MEVRVLQENADGRRDSGYIAGAAEKSTVVLRRQVASYCHNQFVKTSSSLPETVLHMLGCSTCADQGLLFILQGWLACRYLCTGKIYRHLLCIACIIAGWLGFPPWAAPKLQR
jgi:hypothetical protein